MVFYLLHPPNQGPLLLQIIVFCRFYGKVTVQLRTEEETGSGIDIIKCSALILIREFFAYEMQEIFASGIRNPGFGIWNTAQEILSWIHNKDTANCLKKGAFCQMWKSFLCGRLYDAFF